MYPESGFYIIFCWTITIVILIMSDQSSFEKNFINFKLHLIGLIFSAASIILSVLPQRYDIQTTSNTITFFNQTVDLTPPGAGGLTTPIDFTRFIISLLLTVLTGASFLITLIEDPL